MKALTFNTIGSILKCSEDYLWYIFSKTGPTPMMESMNSSKQKYLNPSKPYLEWGTLGDIASELSLSFSEFILIP